jgi:choline dehydrogenase-like flavoprotein
MARQFAPSGKRVLLLGARRPAPARALLPRRAYMKNVIPVAGCAHQAGACRFGTVLAVSALSTECRAHKLDNFYVVHTSVFPSIGAVNPPLTAMANTRRGGDHRLAWLA